MKKLLITILPILLSTQIFACSCIYKSPIIQAASYADLVIIGEMIPSSPFSYADQILVKQVISGDSSLVGKMILIWSDVLSDCSSRPNDNFKKSFLFALDTIDSIEVNSNISYSQEFDEVKTGQDWQKLTKIGNSYHNFTIPTCSISYLKLGKINRVKIATIKRNKDEKKSLIIPYKKGKTKLFTKDELIAAIIKERSENN